MMFSWHNLPTCCMGLLLLQLLGCASAPLPPTPSPLAKKTALALPASTAGSDTKDPALEEAFKRYLRTGKAADIQTDGFEVLAYNTGQQPLIKTTPFEETVVSLEPGEKFTNISSGDPARWSYAVAVSGTGAHQQQHVLIKPSAPAISTNMVITTDRRLYTLRLIASFTGAPARTVRFWYPDDKIAAIAGSVIEKPTPASGPDEEDRSALHFNYRLSHPWFGKTPAWKPTRIFDDGTRTYIELPSRVLHQDLPAFFTVDDKGEWGLTNYRSKPPYLIVDTVFQQGVLVTGVGRQQAKITVTRV